MARIHGQCQADHLPEPRQPANQLASGVVSRDKGTRGRERNPCVSAMETNLENFGCPLEAHAKLAVIASPRRFLRLPFVIPTTWVMMPFGNMASIVTSR